MVNPPTGTGLPVFGLDAGPSGARSAPPLAAPPVAPVPSDAPPVSPPGPPLAAPPQPVPRAEPAGPEEAPAGPGWFRPASPAAPIPPTPFQPFPTGPVAVPDASAELVSTPPWTPTLPSGPGQPGVCGSGGRLPAVGAPMAGVGWTLPATHTDLFAPADQAEAPGFGSLPPELAAFPDQLDGDAADGSRAGLAGGGQAADSGTDPDGLLEDLEDLADDADERRDDEDDDEPGSGEPWVSYTAARAGWRRRVLRVRVRSDGAVPELVLVARPGVRPPETLGEGQVLARLAPAAERTTRTMEIRLEGALLPWGVRLLPVRDGADAVEVDHPADDALIVR